MDVEGDYEVEFCDFFDEFVDVVFFCFVLVDFI